MRNTTRLFINHRRNIRRDIWFLSLWRSREMVHLTSGTFILLTPNTSLRPKLLMILIRDFILTLCSSSLLLRKMWRIMLEFDWCSLPNRLESFVSRQRMFHTIRPSLRCCYQWENISELRFDVYSLRPLFDIWLACSQHHSFFKFFWSFSWTSILRTIITFHDVFFQQF